MQTDYHAEIVAAAERVLVSPTIIEAIVLTESAGQAEAFRFEPGIAKQIADGRLKPKHLPANPLPRRIASSYGLMQILFITAGDYGFVGEPEMLFVPRLSLEFGCAYFAHVLKWAGGDYGRALSAYNGGIGMAKGPGPWRNQDYVTKVLAMEQSMKA
jgi:transglycosylase-like protein with SLT domain